MDHLDLLNVSGTVERQKQKAPAFIDRNARALEMSCLSSSWRLYPERSITPHSICGSGRLLPGLESETRRAESMIGLVTDLVVAKDTSNPERGQDYSGTIRMSRQFCKMRKTGEGKTRNDLH
jgi:hypothetical protein